MAFPEPCIYLSPVSAIFAPCAELPDSMNHRPSRSKAQGAARPAQTMAGLAARRLALRLIRTVLEKRQSFDDVWASLEGDLRRDCPEPRDRGFVLAIAMATLRRLGTLRKAITTRLNKPLPELGPLEAILLTGAAQILILETPAHAAVDMAVTLVREDYRAARFDGLVNAVLRRIAAERDSIIAQSDPLRDDTPGWLAQCWITTYGAQKAHAIAAAHSHEVSIDLSVKTDPQGWAEKLGGFVLPMGSVRLNIRAPVETLPGFAEGDWWVQDGAAALAVQVLAPKPGEFILDLCAAPGGKTAQLATAGAKVVAVERSRRRLERLRTNLERLRLNVETIEADAETVTGGPYDAILLDAPCSATGTLRRHPDVAWLKTPEDIARLALHQARLLDHAIDLLKPGGRLVYATCSLQPEEGENQIVALLSRRNDITHVPIDACMWPGLAEAIDPAGNLRLTPDLLPHSNPRLAGLDGFFIAHLRKG